MKTAVKRDGIPTIGHHIAEGSEYTVERRGALHEGANPEKGLIGTMERKTVLVADDNKFIRMLVLAALRPLEIDILEATDGQEALDAACEHAPDLILLDVVMPHMSGFDVLEALRSDAATADYPVAMLTTAASEQDRALGAQHHVASYIVKPFDKDELRGTVAGLLGL